MEIGFFVHAFQSLIGLILTRKEGPDRNGQGTISIPYRSYSNGPFGFFDDPDLFISIPYRSYSNSMSICSSIRSVKFQSLIGLILTPPPRHGP